MYWLIDALVDWYSDWLMHQLIYALNDGRIDWSIVSFFVPGTESELKSYMTICVETVQKYGLDDYRTPVFVFERLSSIVYPEANDIGEFFLALEKDPQQEDFLQGKCWIP